ncbi:MAG: protein translocase subunit SecF [Candidatus Eremiobacteraeota bacterium]|nr:protein translocase subunit SecF [Candidatus Eremiobacteraeota bacterium]MBV8332740.1 protein translocase subunit SecF [Candidatus Eremiobacteraeota bacterium]MBV8723675.1 protein translocase subunit SecF [Candidatus Eremiobacteraeota bacterium]
MLFRRLNWNIVGWFNVVSWISYLVIALGIGSMFYHGFQGPDGQLHFNQFQPSHMLRLGLSFTGGTDITVKFTQPTTADKVKDALAGLNMTDESITTAGSDGTKFVVQTQTSFANDSSPLWNALNTVAPVDRASSQITAVGPSLGQEYLTKALWALVIALGIQFLYIAFRFGWNYIFGLVTVIALVRDAAMMIGIYALADKRADDAFLAAVLTVIGYSVMDTIVILDRIRENTKLMAGQPYNVIVNESIKQTMTRSFNTLATVVITLVALLALGGASLKNFAFALLVGICSGGYHSIFYSAPLVLVFRKRQLEAAQRRRRAGLVADRTSGSRARSDASAQVSRGGMAREDIVAARRERRQKAKTSRTVQQTGPARYRRKRDDVTGSGGAVAVEDAYVPESEIDPLDAQNAGLHERALEQGHEEISLNLDEFDEATESGENAAHGEEEKH